MAKQVKMEAVDRISDLPDSVLSHILSFLSTKEAVGTSILSTRWRYLFTLVSNLDFELADEFTSSCKRLKSSTIKSFMCFVDRVLFFRNTTSVDKFRLKCGERVDSRRVYGWISSALWRGVKHLALNISLDNYKSDTLPGVMFTCRTLVTLKLDIDFVLNVPNDVCLPNLKNLHLKSIEFSNDDSVKSFFSSCLTLEDLVMEKCGMKMFNISHNLLKRLTILWVEHCSSVVIDTPTLAYFKYADYVSGGYSLKNLQSLVRADVDFHLPLFRNNNHQASAESLFRGIHNVQSLNLSSASLMLLSSCEWLPVFPKLLHLNICHDRPMYYYSKRGLANLLTSLYDLEELAFIRKLSPISQKKCLPVCCINSR